MVSRKTRMILMVIAVLLVSISMTAATFPGAARTGKADVVRISVQMTGAAEAPGPGDPDGSGTALFKISPDTGRVCWTLKVSGIDLPASAAHIHIAPPGSPGPVVIPLSAPGENGKSKGCTTVALDLVKAIVANPGAYYVNVHNPAYPPGAVRGQLDQ